jgi:hypothetical protein
VVELAINLFFDLTFSEATELTENLFCIRFIMQLLQENKDYVPVLTECVRTLARIYSVSSSSMKINMIKENLIHHFIFLYEHHDNDTLARQLEVAFSWVAAEPSLQYESKPPTEETVEDSREEMEISETLENTIILENFGDNPTSWRLAQESHTRGERKPVPSLLELAARAVVDQKIWTKSSPPIDPPSNSFSPAHSDLSHLSNLSSDLSNLPSDVHNILDQCKHCDLCERSYYQHVYQQLLPTSFCVEEMSVDMPLIWSFCSSECMEVVKKCTPSQRSTFSSVGLA